MAPRDGRGALVALLLATSWVGVEVGALSAQAAPEDEVIGVVDQLFDAMREKDEAALRAVFHADARLHTAGNAETGTPIDRFIRNVVGNAAHLDEVTFEEEVRVHGDLAVAWTPYNLFVDGEFSHCGVDAFTLVRTGAGWKILQIVDTREREGCDPTRRK
ncbi:MAG: nuclear transport factor 2 family protein [Longimicrobiales bacterium]|nr:nuclear transport factor 2 family protein [Longimicrobiales bacterium]